MTTLFHSVVTVRTPYGNISTTRSEYAIEKKAAQRRAERWAEYSRTFGKNEILSIGIERVRV